MRASVLLTVVGLLSFCADGSAQDLTSNLLVGARDGQTASVRSLIATGQVRLDAQNSRGWTPLMEAALRDHDAVVRLLIEAGATIDLTNEDGETALHLAAYFGATESARALLDGGADPNRGDEFRRTPWTWAEWGKNKALVELLETSGADGSGRKDPFESDCPPARLLQEPPDISKMKRPKFTEGARERVNKGEVVLEVLVQRNGRIDPDSIRLVEGLDAELDADTMDLVRDWKFEPGKVQGQPVKSLVRIRARFVPAEEEAAIYVFWSK